ncbi:MAG: GNAT family N-acetyltransferase [Candidatus Altiarchaeota archaeon]
MFAIEPTERALQILRQRGKKYKLFPALLIARLGVDKNFMLKGVGTEIIKTIIGLALKESEKIGCRFIVVDAYSDAVGFYEHNEFKVLSKKKTDSETIKMYLDLLREF